MSVLGLIGINSIFPVLHTHIDQKASNLHLMHLLTVLVDSARLIYCVLSNQGDDTSRSRDALLGKCKEAVHVRCGSSPC